MALPFVPLQDLETVFDKFYVEIPDETVKLWEYFEETIFVVGLQEAEGKLCRLDIHQKLGIFLYQCFKKCIGQTMWWSPGIISFNEWLQPTVPFGAS